MFYNSKIPLPWWFARKKAVFSIIYLFNFILYYNYYILQTQFLSEWKAVVNVSIDETIFQAEIDKLKNQVWCRVI